jgi:mannose-6-phosphate isomerase-like protein (cupin superfamily)
MKEPAMPEERNYRIHTDVRFGPLERFDVDALVDACTDPWWNQTLTAVNDCVFRLGILRGEFHWHHHDEEDELFFVLSGRLLVDLEEETVELGPHQGITVPCGERHRTRAPERTVVLMMSGAGVVPVGDD